MDRISQEMATWDRDNKCVNLCKAAFDVAFCTIDGPAGGGFSELPDALEVLNDAINELEERNDD